MVVSPAPRISSHFVRPFQDFIATTHSQLTEQRESRVENDDDVAGDGDRIVFDSLSHHQSQLLLAIINNSPEDLKEFFCSLEKRQHENEESSNWSDPNFSFIVSRIPQNNMDLMFAIKALLGESPTPLHVAILNVFFQSTNKESTTHGKLQPQRLFQKFLKSRPQDDKSEVNKSHSILQILLEHNADLHKPSMTIFRSEEQSERQSSPLNLAWQVHSILSKTEEYDAGEMEFWLLHWGENCGVGDGSEKRDDNDNYRSVEEVEIEPSVTSSSGISPTMLQRILRDFFLNKQQQAQKAYTLHTSTTLGFMREEFESNSVVCGKGFHLLCNDD